MMYNELDLLGEERLISLENITCQKEKFLKHYNKKVTRKYFQVRDLVRKVILLMDKKSKAYGKWSLNWDEPLMLLKHFFSRNVYAIHEVNTDSYIGLIK